ncbi:LysR family transcriptional regulator [Aestuariicella hydrocarbonica]|uniref:LysR family transcriptional regulator n=1 Tax=Pseudomaricurvus hydrocarbonicus TaxID=1470433 RepID=A0A9E5MKN3_9GAMM|nr:LysR family transcriptional regulator [Aestuariicella hydrocarbonica]NHO66789.1 LysR family transcriptional regulator [Aestuariicella hydrocarbonica]
MRIDPRGLRLFLAVCREGTISGAAHAEHLSQPSVSVAISQLERALGTKLFERFRKGIELTPAGEALQRRAMAIENLMDTAYREIQLLGQDIAGPLVVGGTPGALASLVPKVLSSFTNNFPTLEIRLLERPEPELHKMLRNYEIDLAVVTTGMKESPNDMKEMPIFSDSFSIIVGKMNDQLPNELSLADVEHSKWVLPDAIGGFRRQVDALFISAQAPIPHNVIRSDSLLTTKAIVRQTDYITILPREVVMPELQAGTLREVRIREVTFQRQVGFLWLKERELNQLIKTFLEHAKEQSNI